MDIEKVIQDLTSKESQPIRESGLTVIQNSQNEKQIESLIPFLFKIKQATNGLQLGGAFASNNRFYKFPIEIIEFYKNKKSIWRGNIECSCSLYLSKSYENFNLKKKLKTNLLNSTPN